MIVATRKDATGHRSQLTESGTGLFTGNVRQDGAGCNLGSRIIV